MEAACGCKKQLDFDRRESCRACKGTGAKDGVEMKDCVVCDGKGRIFQRFGGNSFIKMESTCSSCRGTGKVISAFCPECHSKGFITKSASVEINIPAGIESGMKVHLREQGDRGVNGRCGDLYCTVQIMPHALFQRQGKDILLTVPISYTQAVLGAKLEIPYLHGKCDLIVPSGTKSGAILRLHALGLPDIRHGGTGNLLVKVEIDTPKVLGLEYVELLNKLRIMEETNISINIAVFNEKVRLNEN
jgi:molecular chaperone DnaJ